MILIIYGGDNDVFESDKNVPEAICELYEFSGGSIEKELFEKMIMGLNMTGGVPDLVEMFDELAIESPIKKIYVGADKWFDEGINNG